MLLAGCLASLSLTLEPAALFNSCIWGGVATCKLMWRNNLDHHSSYFTQPSPLVYCFGELLYFWDKVSYWLESMKQGCLSERLRNPPISACPALRLQECIAIFSFKKIWVLGDWIHIITLVRHTVYQLNHLPGFRLHSHTSLLLSLGHLLCSPLLQCTSQVWIGPSCRPL